MEAEVSSNGLKRKQTSTEPELYGVPAFKRSTSLAESELTDCSESDYIIPKIGDTPPLQKQQDGPETFYGLPMEVKNLLKKYRKIDELYEWQSRLMKTLMDTDSNVVYSVPTSGGKTLVAELMIIRELLVHKRNCLLVLPYVSIVQEKLKSMYPFAEKLGFMIEEFAGSRGHLPLKMRRTMKTLYVATIEKANLVIMSLIEMNKFDTLGLMVIDELHMIGDGSGRGATLESLIIKCKIASFKRNPTFRMLGMSATLSNFHDLEKFMDADVIKDNFRPVELKEYVKIQKYLYDATDVMSRKHLFEEMKLVKEFPAKNQDGDDLVSLVSEIIPEKSCLIFCPTKKHCETVATFLTTAFLRIKGLRRHRTKEKERAISAIQDSNDGSICPVLLRTIPSGIAYHHSGLTPDEREVIETSFLSGVISCIVCTSTLAAGVNLPAERVIIREPYVGREFLSKAQYQQMCGRAGRAGMADSGLSILMCSEKDKENVQKLIESPVPSCTGCLMERRNDLASLLLNLFHTQLVTNADQAREAIVRNGFSVLQTDPKEVKERIESCIQQLFNRNLIEDIDGNISITMDGRGIVRSLINVDRCSEIHDQLVAATNALSVANHLHLIFISTSLFAEAELPYDVDAWILFESYMNLTPEEKKSAEVMGFNITTISRARDTGRCDSNLKRFFITLLVYDAYQNKLDLDMLSRRFGLQRGQIHSLLNQVASHSSSLFRFVEEKKENLWAFASLLPEMCQRLTYCCNPELIPLMELPGVKLSRAKQLLNAGYRDIVSLAKAKDRDLMSKIDKINLNQARKIIKAARFKINGLKEELEEQVKSMELNESINNFDVSNSAIFDSFDP